MLAGPPTTKTRWRAKVIWSPFCTWLRKAASSPRVSVAFPPFGRVSCEPADSGLRIYVSGRLLQTLG